MKKFKVKRNFNKVTGTYSQGYVTVDYTTLVKLFGEPMVSDGYKVDAQWVIEFEDGAIATIYNYKDGKNYNGEHGLAVEEIRNWHIGGFQSDVVDYISDIVAKGVEEKVPEFVAKRKLFYTVEKGLQDVGDDIQELTGWKNVTVYEIIDNEPKKFFDMELSNSENTKEMILGYLEDNGYGDDMFELRIL